MKLAILFWFYKEPEVCQNRLELLRQHNPDTPIYGLYGGDLNAIDHYRSFLEAYLDDFYAFTDNQDPYWKWIQGDLMITQWYRDRGHALEWDTIIVVQWDMLVTGAVEQLFSMLQPGQILLSGLRSVKEVEQDWLWIAPKIPDRRQQYLKFLEYVTRQYNYQADPLGCLFIVVCFPRHFLQQYSAVDHSELGFLEYRIPIYAQIFGVPFCETHPFSAWWVDADPVFNEQNRFKRVINTPMLKLNPHPLNPAKQEISLLSVGRHLITPDGARIFHPYEHHFPLTRAQWFSALIREFKQDVAWLTQGRIPKLIHRIATEISSYCASAK